VKLQRIDSVTGWARYRVSVDGQLVGSVAEEREWLGHRYARVAGALPTQPDRGAFGACWRSQPCRTRQGALDARPDHLEHHAAVIPRVSAVRTNREAG
jgi:hypothetical protein